MARTMGCSEAVHRLWSFLDHELDAQSHQEVEHHLAWCLRCCGELEFARELRTMLQQRSTDPPLPDDVHERLERFIDDLSDSAGPGVTS